MDQDILNWINNYQSDKEGIVPYAVAILVAQEFHISIEYASYYVIKHIHDVLKYKMGIIPPVK